ncbi:MAG: cyclase family protein [Chloroflexi bacterium]|nr:cyclase family protein [Chloroflexota bacterium]
MQLLDLSVPLNERTPIYPGDPTMKIRSHAVLDSDGYEVHSVCLGTHLGTHIDAPSHMLAGGKNLNQIPLEKFSGRGVYIKIESGFDLEVVKKVPLAKDDIVLFDTGMSICYDQPRYFQEYPPLTEAIANYLVEREVKMIGVDMCSVDYSPFTIHKILLEHEILIIENLTGLSRLQGQNFTVHAFPLPLPLDGSPTRVVAQILPPD